MRAGVGIDAANAPGFVIRREGGRRAGTGGKCRAAVRRGCRGADAHALPLVADLLGRGGRDKRRARQQCKNWFRGPFGPTCAHASPLRYQLNGASAVASSGTPAVHGLAPLAMPSTTASDNDTAGTNAAVDVTGAPAIEGLHSSAGANE